MQHAIMPAPSASRCAYSIPGATHSSRPVSNTRWIESYDGKLHPKQSEATPESIGKLESRALAAGAKDIKYVKVPRNAILQQPKPRGDGGMQSIDHAACRDWFDQSFGCAICLAGCPCSVAGCEKVKSRFKGNPRAPQFRIPVATNLEADQPNPVEIPGQSIRG